MGKKPSRIPVRKVLERYADYQRVDLKVLVAKIEGYIEEYSDYDSLYFEDEECHSYGDYWNEHHLIGERLETDEEYAERIAKGKEWKRQQEERERKEFERLQKKFTKENK